MALDGTYSGLKASVADWLKRTDLTSNIPDLVKLAEARIARDFPRRHPPCPVGTDRALDHAIMTAPGSRDPALLAKLDAVAGRVLKPAAG